MTMRSNSLAAVVDTHVAEIHARQRAAERYHLDLTDEDMSEIAERCWRQIDLDVSFPSKVPGRTQIWLRYRGRLVKVVYEAETGIVVTVLPDGGEE